ncbi:hypothetical protein [Streptomyces sp. NPDC053720]|uniref:hypothetical protein n=1 Tax=Streptomyces sp. NPDC053720 TaxID=3154855 RepID=UPI0034415766
MTSIEEPTTLATFGSAWAVLAVGHNLADHVLGQSDHQAASKGSPTAKDVAAGASPRQGWGGCLAHVASLGVAQSGSPGSTMTAEFSEMHWWAMDARQVSRTEAVAV